MRIQRRVSEIELNLWRRFHKKKRKKWLALYGRVRWNGNMMPRAEEEL